PAVSVYPSPCSRRRPRAAAAARMRMRPSGRAVLGPWRKTLCASLLLVSKSDHDMDGPCASARADRLRRPLRLVPYPLPVATLRAIERPATPLFQRQTP